MVARSAPRSGRSEDESPQYVIRGGRPVGGTITAKGNKNAALPMLAATLLTPGTVRISNVPVIRDVQAMLALVDHAGAEVNRVAHDTWEITASEIRRTDVHEALARRIRASFLMAGPLLAREGACVLPRPGGDRIGRRPLDTHIHAFRAMGAEIEVEPNRFMLRAPKGLHGAEIFLNEMSVMATENAVMAASLAEGITIIRNAASEPHVQDLCQMINTLGGRVQGIGTNTLFIEGQHELRGGEVRVGPDHVEVGSLVGLAAVTGGELLIKDAHPTERHSMTPVAFGRLGIRWEVQGDDMLVPANQCLEVEESMYGGVPKIDDGPWPAFPADLTSIMVVLATQAKGTVLIHEKMFESRLFWVDHLIGMGANIVLCDPHRAVVVGPSKLYPKTLPSPDIRAGMALVIAALCADGESIIQNVQQVERGYEALDDRLRSLGAQVERI